MKFYLSSYKIGNETKKFKQMFPKNRKTAYIPNALDHKTKLAKRKKSEDFDIKQLSDLGLEVETLDLRDYFGQKAKLRKKIKEFGVIWVRGGNTFVLRQAMKLSGFDDILKSLLKSKMLYGGYSAGICVLAPSLKGLEFVDDPKKKPYKKSKVLWDGLGIIKFALAPHYKSDHTESKDVNKVVEYYIQNKILFKALRDGEVIII